MSDAPKKPSRRPRKRKARAPAPEAGPVGRRVVVHGPLAWSLLALGALLTVSALLLFVVYPELRNPGVGRDVELELEGDEAAPALAARLHAAGTIRWPTVFSVYVRVRGVPRGSMATAGPHLVADDLTPRELLDRLARSGARTKVVIPEGFTTFDIGKRLHGARITARRAFLSATTDKALLDALRIDGASAEGYLFPATYEFPQNSGAADVIRRMKLEFDRRYAALEEKHGSGVNELQSSLNWGRKEIVTMASLVEKEAVMDDERPMIAAAFLNRLRDPKFQPMLLQCDPTAGYGCLLDPTIASCRTFTGKITPQLVADPANPYNTYKHPGLPPGPIANPGAKSLEAVMAPAATRALYFVAKGGGRHTFSESYGDHHAAVKGKAPAPRDAGEALDPRP